jgi:hypothetical protein
LKADYLWLIFKHLKLPVEFTPKFFYEYTCSLKASNLMIWKTKNQQVYDKKQNYSLTIIIISVIDNCNHHLDEVNNKSSLEISTVF